MIDGNDYLYFESNEDFLNNTIKENHQHYYYNGLKFYNVDCINFPAIFFSFDGNDYWHRMSGSINGARSMIEREIESEQAWIERAKDFLYMIKDK